MKVNNFMTNEVLAFTEDHTIEDACNLMMLKRISHVPVVDKNYHFAGMVSHKYLLRKMLISDSSSKTSYDPVCQKKLSSIMFKEAVTINPDLHVSNALQVFVESRCECLPVVSDGFIVGIVTESDLLPVTCEYYLENSGELHNKPYLKAIA